MCLLGVIVQQLEKPMEALHIQVRATIAAPFRIDAKNPNLVTQYDWAIDVLMVLAECGPSLQM